MFWVERDMMQMHWLAVVLPVSLKLHSLPALKKKKKKWMMETIKCSE
jgi:predicted nucleic acid-binding OB-fold protein